MNDKDKMNKLDPQWEHDDSVDTAPSLEHELRIMESRPTVPGESESHDITQISSIDPSYTLKLFDDDELKQLPGHIKHGFFSSVPLVCLKEFCPYLETCPYKEDITVMGDRCVVEMYEIANLVQGYMNELKVQPEDIPNMVAIKHVVSIDMKIKRIEKYEQIHPTDIFIDQGSGADRQGNIITKVEAHPSNTELDRLYNQRRKMLIELMGTKKARSSTIVNEHHGSIRVQRRREARAERVRKAEIVRRERESGEK